MTYCANCGKEAKVDAKFCQHCGQALLQIADQKSDATETKSNGRTLVRSIWKWVTLLFFGLVTVSGFLSVVLSAINFASGRPLPANAGIGVFWWSIGFAYLFKTLSWNKSEFVKKSPIVAGLFSAWLIGALIYAVAIVFIHRS